MTLITELEAIAAQLRALMLDDLVLANDAEVVGAASLGGLIDRLASSVNVAVAGEIAERSRPELGFAGLAARHGQTRPAALVERLARVPNVDAVRRVKLGSALRARVEISGWQRPPQFPETARALADGDADVTSALAVVQCLEHSERRTSPDDIAHAERVLVAFARSEVPDDVARLARAIQDRLDPEGVHPREQETRARRGIRLGREKHGVRPISGGLDPEFAALLESELSAANAPGAKPRFLADDDRDDAFGTARTETVVDAEASEPIIVRDTRTREQRQHDVMFGLVKAGIRNTGTEAGQVRSTADVTGVMLLKDLVDGSGTGYLEGVEQPVSAATIRQLLCDAKFRRVLLGNDGEVLALGKSTYPFSTGQRRAIILRDGDRCLMCNAPASWGDAHHVVPFNEDGAKGETEVDNGVILCPRHHSLFHHSHWKIRMRGGLPEVLAPPDIDWWGKWRRVGRSRFSDGLSRTG